MIDNAIIVIDNIVQKAAVKEITEAVVEGVKEVAGPLISSALTTVSVFVPLIFLSGMAGALFYDQAVSVSAGLAASILVSLIVIPVLFRLLIRYGKIDLRSYRRGEAFYDRAYHYFFKRKRIIGGVALAGMLLWGLFYFLPKEKFPGLTRRDTMLILRWQRPLDTGFRRQYLDSLLRKSGAEEILAYIGRQDFILQRRFLQDPSESRVYLRFASISARKKFEDSLRRHPPSGAFVSFEPPANVFYYMFRSKEEPAWKIYRKSDFRLPPPDSTAVLATLPGWKPPVRQTRLLRIDPQTAALYDVPFITIRNRLQALLKAYTVDRMKNEKEFVPLRIKYPGENLYRQLQSVRVENRRGISYPLHLFVRLQTVNSWKRITADRKGEYLPYDPPPGTSPAALEQLEHAGDFFAVSARQDPKRLIRELAGIMLLSIILLYLIMAAQFESLWQPLVILLEIPIDAGFAFLFLALARSSINIMSLIGLVVMSGIVVNDSILKIHTINLLRRQGFPLEEAVHRAGKIRLKPILMTTFTTVLALLPVLFMKGMGAELQKPLALVITGGLLFGTFISLFFIPLAYMYLARLFSKKSV